MTEETQALVDRLEAIAAANVCDLPNMGDEAHEPPEITWSELDEIGRTADAAAAALTSLARDLETAHGRIDGLTKASDGLLEQLAAARQERDAALAARDEARRIERNTEIARMRASERADEAEELLKTRAVLVDVAKTGENWPCNACGFGHSAIIDAHYAAHCDIRAQLAEHERDEARAAVRAARAETDTLLSIRDVLRTDGGYDTSCDRIQALIDSWWRLRQATAAREGQ